MEQQHVEFAPLLGRCGAIDFGGLGPAEFDRETAAMFGKVGVPRPDCLHFGELLHRILHLPGRRITPDHPQCLVDRRRVGACGAFRRIDASLNIAGLEQTHRVRH